MARRPRCRDCRQPEGHGAAAPGLAPGGQGMWISHPDILYINNVFNILVLHGIAAGEQCQPNSDRVQQSPRGAACRQTLPAMVWYGMVLYGMGVSLPSWGWEEVWSLLRGLTWTNAMGCDARMSPSCSHPWGDESGGTSPRAGACRQGSSVGLSSLVVRGMHTASREDTHGHSSLG